jgi:hypothetical protein
LFVHNGTINSPSVLINNTINDKPLYKQAELMEICSAFLLLDKKREEVADFLTCIFKQAIKGSKKGTLAAKLKGKDRMQLLIDSDLEAEQKTKESRDSL